MWYIKLFMIYCCFKCAVGDENDLKPGSPRRFALTELPNQEVLLTWEPPSKNLDLVRYYTIRYRTDGDWRILNKYRINSNEISYPVKHLVAGKTYRLKVLAHSDKHFASSYEIKYTCPERKIHENKS